MAYEIQHQSHNECLIKFTEDESSRSETPLNFSLIVLGVIALMMGFEFVVVLGLIVMTMFWRSLIRAPLAEFEIELNRPKNTVSVRNTKQVQPKTMIYPLSSFMGFGSYETEAPKRTNKPYAQLFFKFDTEAHAHHLTSKNSLFSQAKQTTSTNGRAAWGVPIRKNEHPVLAKNARNMIAETQAWLSLENVKNLEANTPDLKIEPEPEPEIMRDFRDME